MEKWTPEIMTLSATLYDVSAYCNRSFKTEIRQFDASGTEGLSGWKISTTRQDWRAAEDRIEHNEYFIGLLDKVLLGLRKLMVCVHLILSFLTHKLKKVWAIRTVFEKNGATCLFRSGERSTRDRFLRRKTS